MNNFETTIISKIKIFFKAKLKIDFETMTLSTKAMITKITSDTTTTIKSLIFKCQSTVMNKLQGMMNIIDSDILIKIESMRI